MLIIPKVKFKFCKQLALKCFYDSAIQSNSKCAHIYSQLLM